MSLADDVPGCTDAEEIGSGGFGRVYRARQPAFDRTVAVKVLHGRLDDADTVRRFQRECQAVGAVAGHPNIVDVHDAGGTPSGHPYIVMPYLRRGSLGQRLHHGPMPWQQAVQIGIKIAGALHSAHRAGVLHRDIKPENLLVSDYGEPQLADFGIAQRLGAVGSTTTAAALTPSQGAPELLSGERPSVVSDVYSLSSTIHTLIRGEPPFVRAGDESVYPMLARIATEPPPDLRHHGVPDAVARAVERGMAKVPQHRPATALQFGRELQQAEAAVGLPVTPMPLAEEEPPAGPPGATPPPVASGPVPGGPVASGPVPRSRRPAARTVVVTAVALAVVAAAGLFLRSRAGAGGGGQPVAVQRALLTAADLGPGAWRSVTLQPGEDQAFCNATLQGARGIVTLQRTSPVSVVSQQAAQRSGGGAAGLLGAVRASAACHTWQATEAGAAVQYTVTARTAARIGDDSAEYLLLRTGASGTVHAVQVYVRRGDLLSVVSYATAAGTTDADITYTEGLARIALHRLDQAT